MATIQEVLTPEEQEQEKIQDIICGFILSAESNGQSWDWIGNRLASVLRQYDVVSETLAEIAKHPTEDKP